ncbi:protein of unknown function (plasmid) [Caballeronia sp. S22]
MSLTAYRVSPVSGQANQHERTGDCVRLFSGVCRRVDPFQVRDLRRGGRRQGGAVTAREIGVQTTPIFALLAGAPSNQKAAGQVRLPRAVSYATQPVEQQMTTCDRSARQGYT